MARKPKSAEPSLRDKLSAAFLEAFQADFETHGAEVIESLRTKDPARYVDIGARLIAASEPPVGLPEDAATSKMIERAIEANDRLIDELSQIAAGH
jgi:hypothetical protein